MSHVVWGVLAHVDAGKTTLSEGILYLGKCIKKMGRVDHKDSFMDTDEMEQNRGITIFSSQAEFTLGEYSATLLDTPGHVDFSAEMERTLQVLDYAILIVSGADGVQGHTRTVWKLLEKHKIPMFLFINKMDQEGCDKEQILSVIQTKLSSSCVDFSGLFALPQGRETEELNDSTTIEFQYDATNVESKKDQKIKDNRKLNENLTDNKELTSRKAWNYQNSSKITVDTEHIEQIEYVKKIDNCSEKIKSIFENIALNDETALEHFLESEQLELDEIADLIRERKVFPCFFGSALKMQGVEELFEGMKQLCRVEERKAAFGARVYKIKRDTQGNRLTFLKVTSGVLKVRDTITKSRDAISKVRDTITGERGGSSDLGGYSKNAGEVSARTEAGGSEKVSQLRIYSGNRFVTVDELKAGQIGAVLGLSHTRAGDGLGILSEAKEAELEPVLEYQMLFEPGTDIGRELGKLKQLEEEYPELKMVWLEQVKQLHVRLMGKVQIEILRQMIWERYGLRVDFGEGSICYQETIVNTVEGVGHYEPLRHYAEVHLLMEPLPRGSGIEITADVSEDELDRNWQRLIMTHIGERKHYGVLTGSPVNDIRFTLIAGRAHLKHTEGGDFREATYRAIRQGLMEAESLLLEPFYEFVIEIPSEHVGRTMTDLEQMGAEYEMNTRDGEWTEFTGKAPVACLRDYGATLLSFTKGMGQLCLNPCGYGPCHNSLEVQKEIAYRPEEDLWNPSGSVFCAHGSGYYVPWDQVKQLMHIKGGLRGLMDSYVCEEEPDPVRSESEEELWIGTDEVDAIIERTAYANRRPERREGWHRRREGAGNNDSASVVLKSFPPSPPKEKYLLVDGYNVIFSWEELKELAETNLDAARSRLQDILCNYQGYVQVQLILVFDAYRLKNHETEIFDYHNIHVVFTKEAQTADQYIEQFAHDHQKKYDITVATSDGLEQVIIRGAGCHLMSSREFYEEVKRVESCIREKLKVIRK